MPPIVGNTRSTALCATDGVALLLETRSGFGGFYTYTLFSLNRQSKKSVTLGPQVVYMPGMLVTYFLGLSPILRSINSGKEFLIGCYGLVHAGLNSSLCLKVELLVILAVYASHFLSEICFQPYY